MRGIAKNLNSEQLVSNTKLKFVFAVFLFFVVNCASFYLVKFSLSLLKMFFVYDDEISCRSESSKY